jgi:hypothetical protein
MIDVVVHAAHCCKEHGCKYGNPECPVVSGEVKQDYPCEECKEGGGVRTIELFVWKGCSTSDPCYISEENRKEYCCDIREDQGWEKVTATIQEQPKPSGPRLEDFKFGDEIEVCDGKRNEPGCYISKSTTVDGAGNSYCWVKLDNDQDPVECWTSNIMIPLKNRMMRGQPIFVGGSKFLQIFKEIDETGTVSSFSFHDGSKIEVARNENWRLPTEDELKKMGHSNGRDANGNPWLTEG